MPEHWATMFSQFRSHSQELTRQSWKASILSASTPSSLCMKIILAYFTRPFVRVHWNYVCKIVWTHFEVPLQMPLLLLLFVGKGRCKFWQDLNTYIEFYCLLISVWMYTHTGTHECLCACTQKLDKRQLLTGIQGAVFAQIQNPIK